MLVKRPNYQATQHRKVNEVGGGTLTVSLPADWIKTNDVKRGDSLLVAASEPGQITFQTENAPALHQAEFTLETDDYSYLSHRLALLYRTNHQRITIHHKIKTIHRHRLNRDYPLPDVIKRFTGRFIGASIHHQDEAKTEIEIMMPREPPDLDRIELHIYKSVRAALERFEENLEKPDFTSLKDEMSQRHDDVNKFINYFLREDFSSHRPVIQKRTAIQYYAFLDAIIDTIGHATERLARHPPSPQLAGLATKTFQYLRAQLEMLYNLRKKEDLSQLRAEIFDQLRKTEMTANDWAAWSDLAIILETHSAYYEYKIARENPDL